MGQRGLLSFEMRQPKVSNLEIAIIGRIVIPADNKYVGWIDIVMPARYQGKSLYLVNRKKSNTQEVCSHPQ